MQLRRLDDGSIVRHWTLEDAERLDRERSAEVDAKIRANFKPKRRLGGLLKIFLAILTPRASRRPQPEIQ